MYVRLIFLSIFLFIGGSQNKKGSPPPPPPPPPVVVGTARSRRNVNFSSQAPIPIPSTSDDVSNPAIPPDMQSTSAQKLHVDALNESGPGSDLDTDTDNDTISPCYLLIDTELLFSFLAQVLVVSVLPMLLLFMNLRRNRDLHTS